MNRPCKLFVALAKYFFLCLIFSFICCEDHYDLPNDKVWTSKHFRYHTRDIDDSVCEEVLQVAEKHFEEMQSYLQFDWPSGKKIDYYKFVDAKDFENESPCHVYNMACFSHGEEIAIFSPKFLHQHELIHAYLANVKSPPKMISEGVAETLSYGLACPDKQRCSANSYEEAVTYDSRYRDFYECSAWWMGHLFNTYGPKVIMTIYSNLSGVTDNTIVEAEFEKQIGISPSQSFEEMLESENINEAMVSTWPCFGDMLFANGTEQTIQSTCKTPHFTRAIDFEKNIIIRTKDNYLLGSCENLNVSGVSLECDTGKTCTHFVKAESGRYFIEVQGEQDLNAMMIDQPESSKVQISTDDFEWLTNDCSILSSANKIPNDFTISIYSDPAVWYMKFFIEDSKSYLIQSNSAMGLGTDKIKIELCDSCEDEATNCTQVILGSRALFEKGDQIIKITNLSVSDPYYSLTFSL